MPRDRWAEWILERRLGGDTALAEEVLAAELDEEERERFLGHVRPRFEAGELVGRSAVAYLRAGAATS